MQSILKRALVVVALLVVVGLTQGLPVQAATSAKKPSTTQKTETDISGAVSQSYNADTSVQVGMIVQLKPNDPNTVLALSSKNGQTIYGVVIPVNGSPIVLAPKTPKQQQVLVATNGRHAVLVSNQNGPIKVGDFITISAVDGVAMKAGQDQNQVIGKAAGIFTGSASVAGTVKLKDSTGHQTAVAIGRVPVDMNITHNPLAQKSADYVPGFLQGAAISIANKPVSVARIYLCTVLIIATAIISGITLYSGIRGGMVAVGRNPLSKKSIIKSLIQTVIAGLIIFVSGVLAVYLLLKL